jgi:hypothetical protein
MKRLISVLIFTAAFFGLLLEFVSIAISSVALKNLLFAVGILAAGGMDLLAVRGTRHGKLPLAVLHGASVLFLLGIIALLVLQGGFRKDSGPAGNNINVYSYVNSVGARGSRDLEKALESRNVESGVRELYRYETDTYAAVFYHDTEKVAAYEFYKNGGKYYSYGERKIIFGEAGGKKMYTEEETMAADIRSCLKVDNNAAVNHTGIRPVYGVAGTDVSQVTIGGQKLETVKKLADQAGNPYYFWFVGDMEGTDVTIEGLQETSVQQ